MNFYDDRLLEKIKGPLEKQKNTKIPNDETTSVSSDLEDEKAKSEFEHSKRIQNRSLIFSYIILGIVIISLLVVFGIVIGEAITVPSYRLNTAILITLLSTTSVNIIGLLYLLIKYIFNHWLKV